MTRSGFLDTTLQSCRRRLSIREELPLKNGERRTAHALFFVRSRYNQHFPARVTFAFFDAVWYWIADDFTTLL